MHRGQTFKMKHYKLVFGPVYIDQSDILLCTSSALVSPTADPGVASLIQVQSHTLWRFIMK